MKKSGEAIRMKEDNPTCFDESRVIGDVVYLEKKSMQISLPIINNRSI